MEKKVNNNYCEPSHISEAEFKEMINCFSMGVISFRNSSRRQPNDLEMF